jgi:hypothetical protein
MVRKEQALCARNHDAAPEVKKCKGFVKAGSELGKMRIAAPVKSLYLFAS